MTSAPRALVVDDNPINSKLAEIFLKRLGWCPVAVPCGEDALRMLREQRFDVVLLDLRMPGMGGEEVCRRIRTELGLRTLPVVAYTAHDTLQDRAHIVEAGFSALLAKPASFADMARICPPTEAAAAPGPDPDTDTTK